MKNGKIVGVGEIMLQITLDKDFCAPGNSELNFSGFELDVLLKLHNMGVPVKMVTRLPGNLLGSSIRYWMESLHMDTGALASGGERIGIRYCSPQNHYSTSLAHYDRLNTSFSGAQEDDFDWEHIFHDVNWFHFSEFAACANESTLQLCMRACEKAKSMGVKISCDLSVTDSEWSPFLTRISMHPLMSYVDVLFADWQEFRKTFETEDSANELLCDDDQNYIYDLMKRVLREYSLEKVVVTMNEGLDERKNRRYVYLMTDENVFMQATPDEKITKETFISKFIFEKMKGNKDKIVFERAII